MLQFGKLKLDAAQPVYQQISDFVKREIFRGAAAQGEALPSRRELAALLQINPNTVQKAFRLMEEEGLIATQRNSHSVLQWDDALFAKIGREMTAELVQDFVARAKANGLAQEDVLQLVRDEWKKGEST